MSDVLTAQTDLYVTGLRNAHALEQQAVQLLSRQVERMESYPELEARMRQHIDESKMQATRLEEILHRLGSDSSSMKDAVVGFMGNMAALAHMPMQDEILKNTFANFAFEHFEIATYVSLIAMAEATNGQNDISALKQSMQEEVSTAEFIGQHIAATTQKYMQLSATGQKAGI